MSEEMKQLFDEVTDLQNELAERRASLKTRKTKLDRMVAADPAAAERLGISKTKDAEA